MKTPTELARDVGLSKKLLAKLQAYGGPEVNIMEVCGTHTVAVAKMGLRSMLPKGVRLLSGPGCPVCVTPVGAFDEAVEIAVAKGATIATFGDALRVPGTRMTLMEARARGGAVAIIYSALDALDMARAEPKRQIVFFGLGFETTSPTVAHAVKVANKEGLDNFTVLSAHKALIPAMVALADAEEINVGAFLCPGHASMVIGSDMYAPFTGDGGVPCVVAGFDPNDVLLGVLAILDQIERGEAKVENCYPRAVNATGNTGALSMLSTVFELVDADWRGLGRLPMSGYGLASEYADFDARARFLGGLEIPSVEPPGCRCADVLRGLLAPEDCGLFARKCTPDEPVGACMVSAEGACGAHYRYRGV